MNTKVVLSGSDRLVKDITESIPALLAPSCAAGLFRLRHMAKTSYMACGYYYGTPGGHMAMYVVDGELPKSHRKNMLGTIANTAEPVESCGFFFVNESTDNDYDEDFDPDNLIYSYSHYFIQL